MLNGAQDKYFWPTGSGSSLILEPLAKYSSRTTLIKGLGIEGSYNHFAVRSIFTGAPINDYLAPDPSVASVDQVIARHFKATQASPLPSLHLGARPADNLASFQQFGRSTFFFDPAPVFYDANPVTAHDRIFAARNRPRRPGEDDFEAAVLALTQAELGDLKGRVKGLEPELARLDRHRAALESLGDGGQVDPVECSGNSLSSVEKLRPELEGDEEAAYVQRHYPDIIDAQIDIMAKSVVCGMTRVATLQCNSADGNAEVPIDGKGYGHHAISHGSQDIYSRCQRWYSEKLVRLLDQLDVPDPLDPSGTTTVLDNSCVVVLAECLPVDHGSATVPCYFIGGAGGRLVTGKTVEVQGANNLHLLQTLANVMGVSPADSSHFGGRSLSEVEL